MNSNETMSVKEIEKSIKDIQMYERRLEACGVVLVRSESGITWKLESKDDE